MSRHDRCFAGIRCVLALAWCSLGTVAPAAAATLGEKAAESGCVGRPVAISSGFYKCSTKSGAEAFFNVPDGHATDEPVRKAPNSKATTTPSGFPRVDADTQKGRDDLRRKVLADELSAEEKLLAQARTEYGTGAPPPLPEERADAQ